MWGQGVPCPVVGKYLNNNDISNNARFGQRTRCPYIPFARFGQGTPCPYILFVLSDKARLVPTSLSLVSFMSLQ